MNKNNNCTLLVNGYDKGEDLWDPFFTLLKINWPNLPFPIVLNTESKSYKYEGLEIKTFSLFKEGQNIAWAKRLKETLKRINTDYILFMLDDFWLYEKVNSKIVFEALEIMENNPDISNICLYNTSGTNIDDKRFKNYIKKDKKSNYKLSTQAGIWNRKKLISYLRSHESAWDWELFANIRTFKIPDNFYCIKSDVEAPFSYHRGWVVYRGKWTKSVVEKYKDKFGIEIDYSKRGIVDEDNLNVKPKSTTLKEKIKNPDFFKLVKTTIKTWIHKLLSTI